MCGIAGFNRATQSSIPDARQLARELAKAIENRGKHATGFGWESADAWPYFWKEQGAASRVADRAPLPVGMRTCLVHTRHATKGHPSINANNHPVVAPGIVLVHNGRVTNDDELIDAVGHRRTAIVDSEAFAALVSLGPSAFGSENISELLELVDGPSAVAWLDATTPGALHLARLRQRPLAYGFTRRGDFVFASTPAALAAAASKVNVQINNVTEVPEGTYMLIVDGVPQDVQTFKPAKLTFIAPPDVPKAANVAKVGSRAPKSQGITDQEWEDIFARHEADVAHGLKEPFPKSNLTPPLRDAAEYTRRPSKGGAPSQPTLAPWRQALQQRNEHGATIVEFDR